jgi:hypothetical protein
MPYLVLNGRATVSCFRADACHRFMCRQEAGVLYATRCWLINVSVTTLLLCHRDLCALAALLNIRSSGYQLIAIFRW